MYELHGARVNNLKTLYTYADYLHTILSQLRIKIKVY